MKAFITKIRSERMNDKNAYLRKKRNYKNENEINIRVVKKNLTDLKRKYETMKCEKRLLTFRNLFIEMYVCSAVHTTH